MRNFVLMLLGCLAAVGLALAPQAGANSDPNADADFYRLLTEPDQSHPIVIWNFPLVKAQGLHACQLDNIPGARTLDVIDALAVAGPYTWEDAESIVSSAFVIYCPWNLHSAGHP
jgi:hypothetical protein